MYSDWVRLTSQQGWGLGAPLFHPPNWPLWGPEGPGNRPYQVRGGDVSPPTLQSGLFLRRIPPHLPPPGGGVGSSSARGWQPASSLFPASGPPHRTSNFLLCSPCHGRRNSFENGRPGNILQSGPVRVQARFLIGPPKRTSFCHSPSLLLHPSPFPYMLSPK